MADSYKDTKIMNFPGMTVRIHFPDITPEERAKRMQRIYESAARLLKGDK